MANQQQSRGVPSFVAGLTTARPRAVEPVDADLAARLAAGAMASEAEADATPAAEPDPAPSRANPAPRRRAKAVAQPTEQGTKRGLYLSDAVWDRLVLEARHRKSTASAVAETILSKSLPRFNVTREG